MELNKEQYKKVQDFISKLGEKEVEFEARIKNFEKNDHIDYYKFQNILNNLIFSKESGGYGFSKYNIDTTLDIKFDNMRVSIHGKDNVKMYFVKENFDNIDEECLEFILKDKVDKIDIMEYNVRLGLANEKEMDDKDIKKFINIIEDDSKIKNYRMKSRYSVETPEGLFRFDLTSVKMSDGKSFKNSRVMKKDVNYEVELEYVGEKSDNKKIIDNLFKYVGILLKLYTDNSILTKKSTVVKVINNYGKLLGINIDIGVRKGNQFITANPVTLHKINLVENHDPNILKNYIVSLKADGEKHLMYVNESSDNMNGKIFLIDINMNVKDTGLKNETWSGTLIEGEFIRKSNLFMIYDILYQKGKDIRDLPLLGNKDFRLEYLDKFLGSKIEGKADMTIKKKDYRFGLEKAKELWNTRDKQDFGVDGLIFTPSNESYPKRGGAKWEKLFKWKPAELNSFDFLVKIERNEKGQDIKSPHVIYKPEGENLIYQYKTLVLHVGKAVGDKVKTYQAVQFVPEGDERLGKAKILLDRNEKMIAIDPITNTSDEIMDNTIVEFVYDTTKEDFKWIPIRIRHDKTERYRAGENVFGNDERVALDIWKNVMDPLTIEMLSLGAIPPEQLKESKAEEPNNAVEVLEGEEKAEEDDAYYAKKEYDAKQRLPFQNFHNLVVKMNLIKEVAPQEGGRLLDLAAGKAGDLSKWADAKYVYVNAMDVDKTGLEYAMKYYDNYNKQKPEVTFIWADTSKLIFPNFDAAMNNEAKIEMQKMTKYSFDVVSVQFALHYYFENETKLKNLLQNVADNLKSGGYFIGTCFDGVRVVEALKKKKLIEGKKDGNLIWKIEKDFKGVMFKSPKTNFGKKINVYVKSIDNVHSEYLVNFSFLETMAKKYGLEKVKVEEFGEMYDRRDKMNGINGQKVKASTMSDVEKEFSFLNNAFVFKKI